MANQIKLQLSNRYPKQSQEMANAIHPIFMFVDESYLDSPSGRTGTIQSIVTLSSEHYQFLKPQFESFLKELPGSQDEFKGGRLNSQSKEAFKKFGCLFKNIAAFNAYRYDLKSVFTIDGVEHDRGCDVAWVEQEVRSTLTSHEIDNCDALTAAFSTQLNWFIDHFPAVSAQGFSNPFYVMMDNRSTNAEEMLAVESNGQDLEEIFAKAARKVLAKSKIKISDLRLFSYRFSQKEFGLQAADLFSHLLFNFLKDKLGCASRKTKIKSDFIQELLPSLEIPQTELTDFEMVEMGGQDVPALRNLSKSLQFQIEAPTRQEMEKHYGSGFLRYDER